MDMVVHNELLNKWKKIRDVDDHELLYRFTDNNCMEFVLCFFDDKDSALVAGKKLYFNILFYGYKCIFNFDMGDQSYDGKDFCNINVDGDERDFYRNEEFFFSTKKHSSNRLGLMIFEVDDLDDYDKEYEFDNLEFCGGFSDKDVSLLDDMKNYLNDVYYDEFIQKIFHLFSLIREVDYSVSILLLCQILESLSSREVKDGNVLKVIDECKRVVLDSDIDRSDADSLISAIDNLKYESSRKKIKKLLDRYSKNNFSEFDKYEVVTRCYKYRSLIIHGEMKRLDSDYIMYENYLEAVVLDVIYGYVREKYHNKLD